MQKPNPHSLYFRSTKCISEETKATEANSVSLSTTFVENKCTLQLDETQIESKLGDLRFEQMIAVDDTQTDIDEC